MKIDKSIKNILWPEPYHGGRENFKLTLHRPVVNGERMLVLTFIPNRERWGGASAVSFRVICSKRQNRCTVLYENAKNGKRQTLHKALDSMRTYPTYCYPDIAEKDEQALKRWLGAKETRNHYIPELAAWMENAIEAERQEKADARGELKDEDVYLCPGELPAGLIEYIRNTILPEDNVIVYKKGNIRGLCYQCGERVNANPLQRFKQYEYTKCPNCGRKVVSHLEAGQSYKAEFVANVATIQTGTDSKTLFVRQWHIKRDPTAQWENIETHLEEIARYAVRGNHAAKWQKEIKEQAYMNVYRHKCDDWQRVNTLTEVYDGSFYFFLPALWQNVLSGTSMQYCDLGGYIKHTARANRYNRNPIRFLMDWARYPAIEKLWKAGYTGLVSERIHWINKEHRYTIAWQKDTLQTAFKMPLRLLRRMKPEELTMAKVKEISTLWAEVKKGHIKESEIDVVISIPTVLENINTALAHASARQVKKYIDKIIADEKAKNKAEGKVTLAPASPVTYRDYLADCVKLELDLNDKAVLFPPDIDAAHARTIAMIKHKKNEKHIAAFAKQTSKQQKLAWKYNGLIIRPPTNIDELIAEGAYLHHCVGGYVESVANGNTCILLIRRASEPDTPFYTLEYRNREVWQCCTKHNRSYESDETVKSFVNDWMKHISKAKKKPLKQKSAFVA